MTDNTDNGGMGEIDIDLPTPAAAEVPLMAPTSDTSQPTLADAMGSATEAAADSFDAPLVEENDIWVDFNTPNPHVTQSLPQRKQARLAPNEPALAAMHLGSAEIEKILTREGLDEITEEQIEKMTPTERRLVNVVRSLSNVWQQAYHKAFDCKGDWGQTVPHNDTNLAAGRIRMDKVNDPVLALRSSLGQGALVQVPLWHTGIWLTLRAPSNSELLDLDQQVRMEKNILGRLSNGMVFSNTEVYTVATYAKFVLDHMYSATYEFQTTDHASELMEIIKSTDFPQMMYGMLSAMFPDGYPFRQPCVANPHTCDHMEETVLSFARLSWVDRSRLTDKQKRLMASRSTKRTPEQLKEYQDEFPFDNRSVKLNDSITVHLAVPTLAAQIDGGFRWVDGIADATNSAFGAKLSEVDRYRHIQRAGKMSNLRQYSHWIGSIEMQLKDNVAPTVIEDWVKKDEALEVISGDAKSTKLLDGEILKWIDSCTVSVIGLAKSNCPACQGEPSADLTTHPHLIPLDIGYVFFTLAALKVKSTEDVADAR